MPTLYVTEPGSRIEKDYQRLTVTNPEDDVIVSIPIARVSEVVIVGSVGITTQAMVELLRNEVPLSIITAGGELLGQLRPAGGKNIFLRRKQIQQAADPGACLALAREMVRGKIKNERTLLRRIGRERGADVAGAVARVNKILKDLDLARDTAGLRGQEGLAARVYFQALRGALLPEWEFGGRSRRPPRSPFNALLSLGYTLLTQNLVTAVEVAGLDPYEGFFHADQYGRPALALDLVEEFRSVIVDALALAVVRRRILRASDFEPAGQGWRLTRDGLRRFIGQYVKKLHAQVTHPLAGRPVSYQKCFEIQARQVRKVIEGEDERYHPFLAR